MSPTKISAPQAAAIDLNLSSVKHGTRNFAKKASEIDGNQRQRHRFASNGKERTTLVISNFYERKNQSLTSIKQKKNPIPTSNQFTPDESNKILQNSLNSGPRKLQNASKTLDGHDNKNPFRQKSAPKVPDKNEGIFNSLATAGFLEAELYQSGPKTPVANKNTLVSSKYSTDQTTKGFFQAKKPKKISLIFNQN